MTMAARSRPESRTPRAYCFACAVLVLAAAIACLGAAAANAESTPAPARIVEVPISVSPFDECTGEFVDLSGTLREVVKTTTDAAGGEHAIEIILYSELTGVGESSGNRYRFVTAAPEIRQELSSDALIFNNAGNQVLLSGGSSPNLVHTLEGHFTLSPSGHITNVSNFTFACRG